MNIEKNIIRFSLNHKYNNYKILFNKLNEENKRKVELSEQLKELSPRMQMKLNELVEIKSKILESKNLSFNYEETKMYFLITLKMLSNLNLKYKVDENLFYKGNPMNFNSILAKEINNVALNIDNNKVDIDDFISIFKLIDFKIQLFRNKDLEFKLQSFKNDNLNEAMKSFIYGRGFESLNLLFLNQTLNLDLKQIETLDEWNNITLLKQFNMWQKKNPDIIIDFKNWKDNEAFYKDNFKIPSMDLVDLNNNVDVFIETKNFTLNKEKDLNFNFKYIPSEAINRINNQEKLSKDNTELYYNINIYDQLNNKSFHYNIPIFEFKKFYKKIDNKLQQGIKQHVRNNKVNFNFINLNLDVSDDIVRTTFKLDRKNEIIENSFNIYMEHKVFDNIFKDYKINEKNKKGIDDSLDITMTR